MSDYSRDIESDILRVLAEGPMTVSELEDVLRRPQSTIRRHLRRMCPVDIGGHPRPSAWAHRVRPRTSEGYPYSLTDEGMRVAEGSGLVRRAER